MKIPVLITLALAIAGCGSDVQLDDKLNINLLQGETAIRTLTEEVSIKKEPFSLIFSFKNVPQAADTNIYVHYWATTDEKMYDKFENAKNIDDVHENIGGCNTQVYNDNESITMQMKNGHSALYIDKQGSTGQISHSYSNIDRSGKRIDAWYKVSRVYDCNTDEHVELKDLKGDKLMIYFSLRGPDLNEQKGYFVDINFVE